VSEFKSVASLAPSGCTVLCANTLVALGLSLIVRVDISACRSSHQVLDCTLRDNVAGTNGGGVAAIDAAVDLSGSSFVHNSALQGRLCCIR
jgi:hypothetical protein